MEALLALVALVAAVHFSPLWLRMFVEGVLAASVMILALVGWRISAIFRASPLVADMNSRINNDCKAKSNYVAKEVNDETYMNILNRDAGPYSKDTFTFKQTRTVKVKIEGTRLILSFPDDVALPHSQHHDEKPLEPVHFLEDPLIFDLAAASMQVLPENLPSAQQVKRKYPIAIKFEGERPQMIYLFTRTNKDKEKWCKIIYETIHLARGNKMSYVRKFDEYKCGLQGHGSDKLATFLNSVLARVWFNLRDSKAFRTCLLRMISKTVRRNKVAQMFKHVGVEELHLSEFLPTIVRTHEIYVNQRGMWLDMDIELEKSRYEVVVKAQGLQLPAWLSFLDTLAWLNKPILVKVSVKKGSGTLTLNMPPPPSDSLWYAFREPPLLDLSLQLVVDSRLISSSSMGAHQEGLTALDVGIIHRFISFTEARLKDQLMLTMVMPNMIDVVLPFPHTPLWARKEIFEPK